MSSDLTTDGLGPLVDMQTHHITTYHPRTARSATDIFPVGARGAPVHVGAEDNLLPGQPKPKPVLFHLGSHLSKHRQRTVAYQDIIGWHIGQGLSWHWANIREHLAHTKRQPGTSLQRSRAHVTQ